MEITDIKIHQPVGLLRILTDTELEGWCMGVGEDTARQIQSAYRNVLIGQDPLVRERLWQELVHLDRLRYLPQTVRAYVDVALWDLAGKATDMPVYRLIGGFRDKIPSYKSGGNLSDIGAFVKDALQAREEGFWGYKDHCNLGVDEMIKVAQAVREAVGPEFYLMHDSVQQYTYIEAIRVGRALQEQNYYWFEEPLRDFDLMGLKKLSESLDIPIAAAEYLPGTLYSIVTAYSASGGGHRSGECSLARRDHGYDQDCTSGGEFRGQLRDQIGWGDEWFCTRSCIGSDQEL